MRKYPLIGDIFINTTHTMKYLLFYIDKDYNIIIPRSSKHFEEILSFDKMLFTDGFLGSYYPKTMQLLENIKWYDTPNFSDFMKEYRKKDVIYLGSLEVNVDVDRVDHMFYLFDTNNVTIHHSYCFNYGYEVVNDVNFFGNIKEFNIECILRDSTINEILS